jgi:hypothetical protein
VDLQLARGDKILKKIKVGDRALHTDRAVMISMDAP